MILRWLSQTSIVLLIIAVTTAGAAAQTRQASSHNGAPPFQDATASLSGTLVDSLNLPVSAAKVP